MGYTSPVIGPAILGDALAVAAITKIGNRVALAATEPVDAHANGYQRIERPVAELG